MQIGKSREPSACPLSNLYPPPAPLSVLGRRRRDNYVHIVVYGRFLRLHLEHLQQESLQYVLLRAEVAATTKPPCGALVFPCHVIQELCNRFEEMLTQEEQSLLEEDPGIVDRNHNLKRMEWERERTGAQFEAQRAADRRIARRARYAQSAGQGSCHPSALTRSVLFVTGKIAKRKSQPDSFVH